MFREMRRSKQILSKEDSEKVLARNTAGVLAVDGDDGYPYAVPLSYVYHDGKIYFHSAKVGHKIDAIAENNKVSFCVIDTDQIVPEEFTTYFRSVIAFGKAKVLEDPMEIRSALEVLAVKYSPEEKAGIAKTIDKEMPHVAMVEISIDHLSGKEAIEFVREKQQ
ncbi:nitroimidazol reductase NimA-like FMN-containing flavoprotein (pyridoxamine 5'-phosphate oxidase superfamily) [Clostridiales Family XIII bacterium PM5-7]